MASALVMSPSRHSEHQDEPPLQTPILRLESIFERTRSVSPPSAAQVQLPSPQSGAAAPWRRRSRGGDQQYAAPRGANPEPRISGGNALDGGARYLEGDDAGGDAPEPSPSPEPRTGSRSASSGGSSGGSPSADAVSEVGPLPHEGHVAAAARRSPFRGAASMSLDQVCCVLCHPPSAVPVPPNMLRAVTNDSGSAAAASTLQGHCAGPAAACSPAAAGTCCDLEADEVCPPPVVLSSVSANSNVLVRANR